MMRGGSALFAGFGLLAGCAGHASTMYDVRDALIRNDLEEARALLADAGRGTDDLLFALEDGLLLHYAGDPELSNARLEFAELRIDDLYTRSISRAALSLVTSDLILRFEPRGVENLLINYYRGLNYLQLWEAEDARVEWRKLNAKLQFSRDQGDAPYLDPPFFNHLVGLGLESEDPDNAYVSMRLAEAAYLEQGALPPADLVQDLVRLATGLGFVDHLDGYRSRYGDPSQEVMGLQSAAGSDTVAQPGGEIVLLIEEGLVAAIEEVSAYIPITEERAKRVVEEDNGLRLNLAQALAVEYNEGRYQGVTKSYSSRVGIAYVLPISFPVFGLGEPAFGRLSAGAGSGQSAARVALDVSETQRLAFQDRLLWIYAKSIARSLIKYAAAAKLEEKAEEEGGEVAGDVVGVLANIVNIATERADTRAWLGLPHRIWMARLRVPPGLHDIRIVMDGRDELLLGSIEVMPGERRIVSYRVF